MGHCCSSPVSHDDDLNGIRPMSPETLAIMRKQSIDGGDLRLEPTNQSSNGATKNGPKQSTAKAHLYQPAPTNGGANNGSPISGDGGVSDPEHDRKPSISSVTRPLPGSLAHQSSQNALTRHGTNSALLMPTLNERDVYESSRNNSRRNSPKPTARNLSAHNSNNTNLIQPHILSNPPSTASSSTSTSLLSKEKKSKKTKKSIKSSLTAPNASGEFEPVGAATVSSTATAGSVQPSTKPPKPKKATSTALLEPPTLLSLEDEEDEKTARSLRNYEAETVIAEQEQAMMSAVHGMSTNASGESASPSPSPTPFSPLSNHSRSGTTHQIHFFPSPSPLSGTSASTPRGPSSGANTPRQHLVGTGGMTLSVATAYTNAEFLAHPAEAALLTPGGKRTAMALLLSGNQSARTSPINSPRIGSGGRHPGVSGIQRGFALRGGRGGLSSKTVPNSPARSPDHSRSSSPIREDHHDQLSPVHHLHHPHHHAQHQHHHAQSQGGYLNVPLASPPAGPVVNMTYKLPTRSHPNTQRGPVSQQPYSRSVQTSPRHSPQASLMNGSITEATTPELPEVRAEKERLAIGEQLFGRAVTVPTRSRLAQPGSATSSSSSIARNTAYQRFQARLKAGQGGPGMAGMTSKSLDQSGWSSDAKANINGM